MLQCSFAVTLGLLLLAASYTQEDEQVFLTVEEGVSLVGKKCPDTVNLTCKGVDLPFLRWTYDVDDEQVLIRPVIYPSDVSHSEVDLSVSNQNSPFLRIVIVDILQGQNLADFLTIIIVDLVKLAQQNVTFIRCGQLDNLTDSVAVNLSIAKPSFISPFALNITKVIAIYNQSGSLDSVEVQWTRLNLSCSAYNLLAGYQLSINKLTSSFYVNQTSCDEKLCIVTIPGMQWKSFSGMELFAVQAYINGSLDTFETNLSTVIESNSGIYFKPILNFTGCYVSFSCESNRYFDKNTNCMLQYTANSTNLDPNIIMAPLNKSSQFFILVENTQLYHFVFSIAVNEQLLIKKRQTKELTQNVLLITLEVITVLIISGLFILLSLVHIMTVIIIKVLKLVPTTVKRKPYFVATMILVAMATVCTLLFTLLCQIINEKCSQTLLATQYNVFIYMLIIIACLGLTLLLLIWISWGYQVYQHKKEAHINRKGGENSRSGPMSENTVYESNDDNFLDSNKRDKLQVQNSHLSEKMYTKLNMTALSDSVASGEKYTKLRREEKSHPAESNLLESSCSYVNRHQKTVSVDVPYDKILASSKERVNLDYDYVKVNAMDNVNIDYDYIIDSSFEDSSVCRPDQKNFNASNDSQLYDHLYQSNKSQPAPSKDDPAYSHIGKTDYKSATDFST